MYIYLTFFAFFMYKYIFTFIGHFLQILFQICTHLKSFLFILRCFTIYIIILFHLISKSELISDKLNDSTSIEKNI